MSFTTKTTDSRVYAPGWFLVDNENCTRETQQIYQTGATETATGKFVAMGSPYPAAGSSAIGLVYEDVDVTTGDMPGSVVTAGTVYKDRLPETVTEATIQALSAKGFKFIDSPAVTRPY